MDLQASIECPICQEDFNRYSRSPQVLLCGHTFCSHCLRSISVSQSRILCPLDRKPDPRHADEIPVCVQILHLVDFARSIRESFECLQLSPAERRNRIRNRLREEKGLCEEVMEKLEKKVEKAMGVKRAVDNDVRDTFERLRRQLDERRNTLLLDIHQSAAQELEKQDAFIAEVRAEMESISMQSPPSAVDALLPSPPQKYLSKGRSALIKLQDFGKILSASVSMPFECQHFLNLTYWMIPPCCNVFYCCNKCHDERENHAWQYATKMVCMMCCQQQGYRKLPNACEKCGGEHKSVLSKQNGYQR